MRWIGILLLVVCLAMLLSGCYYKKEVTKTPERTTTVTEFRIMEG